MFGLAGLAPALGSFLLSTQLFGRWNDHAKVPIRLGNLNFMRCDLELQGSLLFQCQVTQTIPQFSSGMPHLQDYAWFDISEAGLPVARHCLGVDCFRPALLANACICVVGASSALWLGNRLSRRSGRSSL